MPQVQEQIGQQLTVAMSAGRTSTQIMVKVPVSSDGECKPIPKVGKGNDGRRFVLKGIQPKPRE